MHPKQKYDTNTLLITNAMAEEKLGTRTKYRWHRRRGFWIEVLDVADK